MPPPFSHMAHDDVMPFLLALPFLFGAIWVLIAAFKAERMRRRYSRALDEVLDDVAPPNEKLKKLLRTPAPWETEYRFPNHPIDPNHAVYPETPGQAVARVARESAPYPHCDANVLHAPGECEYCDLYPERQGGRFASKINFTGKREPGFAVCPSERLRALEHINAWPGNRAKPQMADYASERVFDGIRRASPERVAVLKAAYLRLGRPKIRYTDWTDYEHSKDFGC